MKIELKILITVLVSLIICAIANGAIKAINGNYFATNQLLGGSIMVLFVASAAYGVYRFGRYIWTLGVCAVVLSSCNYAKSNQQVVVSDDCGMTWKKIESGDAVPKAGLNVCYMKVVIPNYPMQGESKFISNKSGKSTLIRSLVKYYTNQDVKNIRGSITVRNGKLITSEKPTNHFH